jgi:hypothetical protein
MLPLKCGIDLIFTSKKFFFSKTKNFGTVKIGLALFASYQGLTQIESKMYMLTINHVDLVFYPHLVFMYMEKDKILERIIDDSTIKVIKFEYGVDKVNDEIFIGQLDEFRVWLDRLIDHDDSSDDEMDSSEDDD